MRNGTLGSIGVRALLGASLLAGSLATAACSAAAEVGSDAGGGGSDAGGGGSKFGDWTVVELIDDATDPTDTVLRKDQDLVMAIYFESPDKGFILTQGDRRSSGSGGAVFKATGSAVTSVAYSDANSLQSPSFIGIQPTPTGYIALAAANQIVSSVDGGNTFKLTKNGEGDQFGIEYTLAFQLSATGTTVVRDTGVVTTSDDPNPGPNTVYEDVWAPNASAPIPETLTPDECPNGPRGAGLPRTRNSVHVSADRRFIAYTSNDDDFHPEVCISTDFGHSFIAHVLDVPEDAQDFTPTGVVFTDALNGIVWFGSQTAGAYVKRTTDGGVTWKDGALPAAIAAHDLELPAGFFAPDGKHGWLAGFDHGTNVALLITTADGGATWTKVDGVGDAVDKAGGLKLYSVFAVDATHVWLGGDGGLLMHN